MEQPMLDHITDEWRDPDDIELVEGWIDHKENQADIDYTDAEVKELNFD
jgi:hypothetical protein